MQHLVNQSKRTSFKSWSHVVGYQGVLQFKSSVSQPIKLSRHKGLQYFDLLCTSCIRLHLSHQLRPQVSGSINCKTSTLTSLSSHSPWRCQAELQSKIQNIAIPRPSKLPQGNDKWTKPREKNGNTAIGKEGNKSKSKCKLSGFQDVMPKLWTKLCEPRSHQYWNHQVLN